MNKEFFEGIFILLAMVTSLVIVGYIALSLK